MVTVPVTKICINAQQSFLQPSHLGHFDSVQGHCVLSLFFGILSLSLIQIVPRPLARSESKLHFEPFGMGTCLRTKGSLKVTEGFTRKKKPLEASLLSLLKHTEPAKSVNMKYELAYNHLLEEGFLSYIVVGRRDMQP